MFFPASQAETRLKHEQRLPWLGHTTELYGAYNTEENSPLTGTFEHTQACFIPMLPHGCTPELKGFVHQGITE